MEEKGADLFVVLVNKFVRFFFLIKGVVQCFHDIVAGLPE